MVTTGVPVYSGSEESAPDPEQLDSLSQETKEDFSMRSLDDI
jgi:hypothetical protein